jgi:hypothetical protein
MWLTNWYISYLLTGNRSKWNNLICREGLKGFIAGVLCGTPEMPALYGEQFLFAGKFHNFPAFIGSGLILKIRGMSSH